jgi:glycerol-3-phosphate dehydrogenase (NAD(P)+)
MTLPVAVLGGGSFGQALARAASRAGKRVILWSRDARDLGDPKIGSTTVLSDVAEAELLFLAVPSPHVSALCDELGHHVDGRHLIVHVSRGLLGVELLTLTEVVRDRTPVRRVGALAGPLVAKNLAEGQPGGAIVGSLFPEVSQAVRDAIGGPMLRLYDTDDVVGVEMASAFVGLVALALGYAQGAGFGPGTLAVLATRGVAESARIGVDRGADVRTFSGLAGYGDLIAAVAGDGRPEVELGKALAAGTSLQDAARSAGAYVEGVRIAEQVVEYASRRALQTPIATAMATLVAGKANRSDIVAQLMTRPTGRE